MEKNRTVQRKNGRKKGRPRVHFSFGMLLMIFILSFIICFVLYMLSANINDNFLEEEFGTSESESEPVSEDLPGFTAETTNAEKAALNNGAITNPVPQSETADISYLANCCLITDSALAGMKENGSFSKGTVFGGAEINTSTVMTAKIESSFGTLSPYDIVKQKKPQILYIMLGSELGTVSADEMISNYTTLISSLRSGLPDMKIYVMQYPPVLYDSDILTNEMVNDYNNKLLLMSNTLGVYCIDTNTPLKSEDGRLNEDYWSYETLSFSKTGLDKITEYILTHVS